MQVSQFRPEQLPGILQRSRVTAWGQLSTREQPVATDVGILQQMTGMYQTALSRPGATVLTVEGAGPADGILAYALLMPQPNPFTAEGEVVVLDIFVDPALRGRRVGRLLLAAADAYARSLGCASLVAQVALQNQPSLRLFQGVGFQPERVVLGRRM